MYAGVLRPRNPPAMRWVIWWCFWRGTFVEIGVLRISRVDLAWPFEPSARAAFSAGPFHMAAHDDADAALAGFVVVTNIHTKSIAQYVSGGCCFDSGMVIKIVLDNIDPAVDD